MNAQGYIMKDKELPKLLVSKAETSKKIQDQINKRKRLTEISATSKDDLTNLKHESRKWCDYNKTLFDTLFDISPLPDSHGVSLGRMAWVIGRDYTVDDIKDHKKDIISWCNQLQSILEQLDLYEVLPKNTKEPLEHSTANNKKASIFIGHGRSHLWREFKDFLVETLGLEYEEFDRISAAGKSINSRIEEMLDKSCMAFLIMTGEDEHTDASVHARQNVIHEIGKCQDRFGFERTIILLEEGCEKFSNIDGIIYISFTNGKIKETFGDVVSVLKRESIIRIELCNQ